MATYTRDQWRLILGFVYARRLDVSAAQIQFDVDYARRPDGTNRMWRTRARDIHEYLTFMAESIEERISE